ncbi:multicopper oxidase [Xylariaceae sp. FL0594]|nr:multicopper oxidase [Xylariaceae sp. FL0594]
MVSATALFGLLVPSLLPALVQGAPAQPDLLPRVAGSCNTATNRACWSTGYDIDTDYTTVTPPGITREYFFDITAHSNWVGPDGVTKELVMLVNNQFPGPTIFADWGDTIVVHVTNSLTTNGTSIHWHGIRQLNTNLQDGANGVTECALAPGHSKTYTFRATQYGSSWYHSHFTAQLADGVIGTIQIYGPSTANYDVDLGVYPITDYYYFTETQGVKMTQTNPIPPSSDNILFNGTNINPNDPTKGAYSVVTLQHGKKHRLRLINPSIEHNYQVSLVGHSFQVIETDFVPIVPQTVSTIFLGIGQRYDVIIDASQPVDNYWFNVTLSSVGLCGTTKVDGPAAIFRYEGAGNSLPTTQGTRPADTFCQDRADWTPYHAKTVPASQFTPAQALQDNLPVALSLPPIGNTVTWYVNASSIKVDWGHPIFDFVQNGSAIPRRENVVVVDQANQWSFWVIQNLSPIPHPMHLHGHDFYVLGRSAPLNVPLSLLQLLGLLLTGGLAQYTNVFNPLTDLGTLNFNNPVRRDVTMLPALGYLVIAFQTDNPGNWLFHCHIAWHVSGGLSMAFVEQPSAQLTTFSTAEVQAYEQVCADWNAYWPNSPYSQIDSGL